MASTAEKLQALQEAFATIDLENIEETLEACGGDLAKTTEVLTEILMEEEEEEQMAAQQRGSSPLSVPRGRAAGSSGSVATDSGAASDTALPDGPPAGTMLRALLDVVVSLAQTPAEQRTAASEERRPGEVKGGGEASRACPLHGRGPRTCKSRIGPKGLPPSLRLRYVY